MPHFPIPSKARYLFCLMLALLVVNGYRSRPSHNWQILLEGKTSHSAGIQAIAFNDARHGWSLNAFQLSETSDGGATWTPQLESKNGERGFTSFQFVNQTTGFVIGGKRQGEGIKTLILRTDDGGKNWQESSVNITPQPNTEEVPRLYSVSFCNPQVGWVGGPGVIAHTSDGGQTWKTQREGIAGESLLDIKCVSPQRAWAVGANGLILHTQDGGQSWRRQSSQTSETFFRVRFFGNTGWIVGGLDGKGALLRTRDDGKTWERVQLETPGELTDIYMHGQQGWIVGTNGTILHTNDGGQTWQRETSPTSDDLLSLFFLNPQQGWIGGDKLTILKLAN